jgi:hypothetical protein
MIAARFEIRMPIISYHVNEDVVAMLTSSTYEKEAMAILLITQFVIWRERCCRTFRKIAKEIEELADQVIIQWRYSSMHAPRSS